MRFGTERGGTIRINARLRVRVRVVGKVRGESFGLGLLQCELG